MTYSIRKKLEILSLIKIIFFILEKLGPWRLQLQIDDLDANNIFKIFV